MTATERLKTITPKPIRRAGKRAIETLYTRPTSGIRLLPDYLIIGGQRCGTTSLYEYLSDHPAVGPVVITKGAHYFSTNFDKSLSWYRSYFPTKVNAAWTRFRVGTDMVTGEGSPYYLFHPLVPERVAATLPDVKLIVMLRDPVSRAYSHYRHMIDRGLETLSFEDALAAEPERLAGVTERMLADPTYYSFDHQHHSYLARGRYAEQLRRWRRYFRDEQLLIIRSEDFFASPGDVLDAVTSFLGIPRWRPRSFEAHNAGHYEPMRAETKEMLRAYFAEPNHELETDLGRSFRWSS